MEVSLLSQSFCVTCPWISPLATMKYQRGLLQLPLTLLSVEIVFFHFVLETWQLISVHVKPISRFISQSLQQEYDNNQIEKFKKLIWVLHKPFFFCKFTLCFHCSTYTYVCRLLIWYLDPLALKHDISKILQETIKRPFLCLSMEFYERMDWRSILVCLVLSPIMFIDTRALLHDWFLQT